ncbi:CinA family protein [Kitasatospora sp. NPDC006697]|uniref:CinA family protein n=1 Tax=Kitasatospora sp. NPDC006697 TaxID=3364020 RepID=UPI0036BAA5CE
MTEYVPLAAQVHRELLGRGATLAVAESLTGGLLAAQLVDVPGASATFRGSVTAYATELKAELLGVDEGLLAVHGPVHPLVARQMAEGVRRLLGATYGLSTTGVAGPEPQDGSPVGTVHLGFAGPEGTLAGSPRLSGDRATIRRRAAQGALELFLAHTAAARKAAGAG